MSVDPCIVCGKGKPPLAVSHDDEFCAVGCARQHFGVALPSDGARPPEPALRTRGQIAAEARDLLARIQLADRMARSGEHRGSIRSEARKLGLDEEKVFGEGVGCLTATGMSYNRTANRPQRSRRK